MESIENPPGLRHSLFNWLGALFWKRGSFLLFLFLLLSLLLLLLLFLLLLHFSSTSSSASFCLIFFFLRCKLILYFFSSLVPSWCLSIVAVKFLHGSWIIQHQGQWESSPLSPWESVFCSFNAILIFRSSTSLFAVVFLLACLLWTINRKNLGYI